MDKFVIPKFTKDSLRNQLLFLKLKKNNLIEIWDIIMIGEVGSLIFIKDQYDPEKKRPFICIHVFRNNAGVPYNWWLVPITSKDTIGLDNLVEVKHPKLRSISYAKINDLQSVKWDDSYEVSYKKFAKKYTKDVIERMCYLINPKIE